MCCWPQALEHARRATTADPLQERFHRALIAASVSMVCLIGVSRVLLQVHYASDVLGGFASGAVWLVACIAMAEHWHHRHMPANTNRN